MFLCHRANNAILSWDAVYAPNLTHSLHQPFFKTQIRQQSSLCHRRKDIGLMKKLCILENFTRIPYKCLGKEVLICFLSQTLSRLVTSVIGRQSPITSMRNCCRKFKAVNISYILSLCDFTLTSHNFSPCWKSSSIDQKVRSIHFN